jgi:AraC-like DNA-binding protein/mannose-6-phosphate isomerase-like protein (cupin superfamily)
MALVAMDSLIRIPSGSSASRAAGTAKLHESQALEFMESISLERAGLKFCERFDESSCTWNLQRHSHPYLEFLLFLEGSARVDAGDFSLDVGDLDLLVYPPGLAHAEHLEACHRQEVICIWADLGRCSRLGRAIKLSDGRGTFRRIFDAIYSEFTGNRSFSQELITCHLRALVWLIRQRLAEPTREGSDHVERCVAYIHEHYSRDYPIEDLAALVSVSPSYLFRMFRKRVGVTPLSYRNLVRIEKAKLLLLDRSLKVEEVAERVGFMDVKYFSRVFRKLAGRSPRCFRIANQGG